MGDHEITGRYASRGAVSSDLASAVCLPDRFRLGRSNSFFPPAGVGPLGHMTAWGPERNPEWVYFLSDEQATVCDEVIEAIEAVLAVDDHYTVQLIVGGPGTGKTSILLQLLARLSSQVVESGETWNVGLRVSDRVAEYVTRATGWDLTASRGLGGLAGTGYSEIDVDIRRGTPTPEDSPDVLLVDDPAGLRVINTFAGHARRGSLKAIVCAFDPLQLDQSITDPEYNDVVSEHNAAEHRLTSCYRQKEGPGQYAFDVANVVAGSSPFLAEAKQTRYANERREITGLANSVEFPDPSGYAQTFLDATAAQWEAHLRWIRSQAGLWHHWAPLLVILDGADALPDDWSRSLARLDLAREVVELRSLGSVKGLEYQHVTLILSEGRYRDLQEGFSGSGQRLYQDYRLLRIPFTRAKDSIAVFVPT